MHTRSSNFWTGIHMSFHSPWKGFLSLFWFSEFPTTDSNQNTVTCASSASSYFLFLFKRIYIYLVILIAKQTNRNKNLLRIWWLTSSYLYNISIIPHISTVVKKHFSDRSLWHIMTTSGIFLQIMEFIFLFPRQTWWNVALPGVSVAHTFTTIVSQYHSSFSTEYFQTNGHTHVAHTRSIQAIKLHGI